MNRFLLLALLVTTSVSAQPAAPPARWAPFVRTFDERARADQIVGASVILVREGRTIAHHEYGLADRAANRRVDERSIFHYGSITKTLTAVAIMQLRDRRRLSLDDKVVRWVPELRQMHDPYGMMDSITIRMLLSHSAGFQNPTWPYTTGKPWEPFEPTTWNQLVAMMPYQELHFRPGSKYSYSNPAFIYLARIIEELTGDPWAVYVQKNIFAPLGLSSSYFGVTPYHMAGDRSNNYAVRRDSATGKEMVVDNGKEFDPGITIPNGGWNAPLSDLATYMAFLTGARAGSDDVLARATLEEMWKPVVHVGAAGSPTAMGLSFFLENGEGPPLVGHTGSQAGFLAFFYINPATRTAVVAAFNTNNEVRGDDESAYEAIRKSALALLR